MTRYEKEVFGVPNKETVDYNKIYTYKTSVINPNRLFKTYDKNRGGDVQNTNMHVTKIKQGIIREGGMSKFPPIVVDINTLTIVDGNCRFAALVNALNSGEICNVVLRVMYEDVPATEFNDSVIRYNINQKKWTTSNYAYNYSMMGHDNYKRLIDFCMSEPMLHSKDKIRVAYAAAVIGFPKDKLADARLQLTDEDIILARDVLHEAVDIKDTFITEGASTSGGWMETYLMAWREFRKSLEGITFKKYFEEVKKSIKSRKKEVKVPFGSCRRADWNMFFCTCKTFCR